MQTCRRTQQTTSQVHDIVGEAQPAAVLRAPQIQGCSPQLSCSFLIGFCTRTDVLSAIAMALQEQSFSLEYSWILSLHPALRFPQGLSQIHGSVGSVHFLHQGCSQNGCGQIARSPLTSPEKFSLITQSPPSEAVSCLPLSLQYPPPHFPMATKT